MSTRQSGKALLTEQQKREFKRNGFVVIEDAIDDALVTRTRESFWKSLPEDVDRDDPETWYESNHEDGLNARPTPHDVEAHEELLRSVYPYARELVGPKLASPGEPPNDYSAHAKIGNYDDIDHDGLLAPYPNYPEAGDQDPTAWNPNGHLDGRDHSYADPEKGQVGDERYNPFTVTCGVYVDRVAPRGGGYTAWPGSHEQLARYFREENIDYFETAQFQDDGDLESDLDLGHPVEVTGGPGTAFIAHSGTVHAASPNYSDRIRMLCLGRLSHSDLEYGSQDGIRHPWMHFDGVSE